MCVCVCVLCACVCVGVGVGVGVGVVLYSPGHNSSCVGCIIYLLYFSDLVFHNSVWKTPTQAVLDGASISSVGPIQHFPVSDGRQHVVPDTSETDTTDASNSEQVIKSQVSVVMVTVYWLL